MAGMKENTRKVINYLRAHNGEDLTAADVAKALGFEAKRSVDGSFTSFQKKGWGYREEDEVETPDGKHLKVKYLRLTELGMTVNLDDPQS